MQASHRRTYSSSKATASTLSEFVQLHYDVRAFANRRQLVHGATSKQLLKIRGFSEVKGDKIKDAVKKCLVRPAMLKHKLCR